MRLFIAIPMPDEMKQKIFTFMADFTKGITGVKWINPDNAHLTLAFLGEQHESQQSKIFAAVKEASKNLIKFKLQLKSVGVFPETGWPRVVWIGAFEAEKNLALYAQFVREELKKQNVVFDEKDFKEHITIGRIRNIPSDMKDALSKKVISCRGLEFGSIEVRSIVVYSSALEKDGHVYTIQKEQNIV